MLISDYSLYKRNAYIHIIYVPIGKHCSRCFLINSTYSFDKMFCTIYDTNHWSNKISYMAKQFFNYIVNVLNSIIWISSFHISKSSHQFKQRIQEGYGFPICLFVSWLLLGIDFYKEVIVYAQMSGNPKLFYFEEHTALNFRQCESRVAHNLHKSKCF